MSVDEAPAKRCAIYVRCAAHPESETSMSWAHAQRVACLEFIRSKLGWQPNFLTYMDIGLSGENMNRPDLQRLLLAIGAGEVDIVVVHDIERLTRSSPDLAKLTQVFREADVGLVIVGEGDDKPDAVEAERSP